MNLTITDIATRTGMSRQHVSRVLRGQIRISLATAARLSQVLGIPMQDLATAPTTLPLGRRRKLSDADIAHARELMSARHPLREIATTLGVSRQTVANALRRVAA